MRSAEFAASFLASKDARFVDPLSTIRVQEDKAGQKGDVRDIVVRNESTGEEVGVSAKNRHTALKSPRLSWKLDVGMRWLGRPSAPAYWAEVTPIFDELKLLKSRQLLWKDLPDKDQRYYVPILIAFQRELERQFAEAPNEVAPGLVHFLVGKQDFYKVIKENGTTEIQSFNLNGTLKWGKRLNLPTRIIEVREKEGSATTIEVYCDRGWSLSFRIHSADSKVVPHVKFDIKLIGRPDLTSTNITHS